MIDQERRSALLQVKLGALARDAFGVERGTASAFPGGATLQAGGRLIVLVDGAPRSVGPALAVAAKAGAAELHLLVDAPADEVRRLAHQAAQLADPPGVWHVNGKVVEAVEARPAPEPAPPPDAPELASLLADAGLDVVVEHGRMAGEVRGLEVARVIAPEGEAPGLAVGVGQADRELTAMVHGELPPDATLARVVEVVDAIRRPGAEPHPLNRLAPERWLRWVTRGAPGSVGAEALTPAPSPRPRSGLRERDVACATAVLADGGAAVVVWSVGVDLDLVPVAAEARAALAPEGELVIVVPERDRHPANVALAAALARPARLHGVEGDWRTR